MANGAMARMAVPDALSALTRALGPTLTVMGRPPPLAPLLMAAMAGEPAPVATTYAAWPISMATGPPYVRALSGVSYWYSVPSLKTPPPPTLIARIAGAFAPEVCTVPPVPMATLTPPPLPVPAVRPAPWMIPPV
ncbi:hypothetical protein D3C87_1772810 [compost metagenome]